MLKVPSICVSLDSTINPRNDLFEGKQWIYTMCEKFAKNIPEARRLAFLLTLWLEYLSRNTFNFSVPFSPKYFQLFALLLFDVALERARKLRERCPTSELLKLIQGISREKVDKLHQELKSLNLFYAVNIELLIQFLQRLLKKIQQRSDIENMAWLLLDAYNLRFDAIEADKPKVAAACVAVARFSVLRKEEQRWPKKYATKTGLAFSDLKDAYQQVNSILHFVTSLSYPKLLDYHLLVSQNTNYVNNTHDANNNNYFNMNNNNIYFNN